MNAALKLWYFTLAESLGGVESLCEVPAVMTHDGMGKEVRENAGVYDDMIRLSMGAKESGGFDWRFGRDSREGGGELSDFGG